MKIIITFFTFIGRFTDDFYYIFFLISIKYKSNNFSFSKRYILRRAYPTIYDDVVFVSEKTMREILYDDLKQVESRYNRQLNNITLDNETLALELKKKNQDFEKLNKQFRTQQVIH